MTRLNASFAPAYVQLARSFLREGRFQDAVAPAKKAQQLSPRHAGYITLVGHVLLGLGETPQAAALARFVAQQWQEIDHDEAVELWQSLPAAARQGEQLAFTPVPTGATVLKGKINGIQCNLNEKTITVTVDGESRTLRLDDRSTGGFSDTLWFGQDHFDRCYHVIGLRTVIQYTPSSSSRIAGTLNKIDIYDNLWPPENK